MFKLSRPGAIAQIARTKERLSPCHLAHGVGCRGSWRSHRARVVPCHLVPARTVPNMQKAPVLAFAATIVGSPYWHLQRLSQKLCLQMQVMFPR